MPRMLAVATSLLIPQIRDKPIARKLAARRVDRTLVHPFPPPRQQVVPQARDPLQFPPSLFHNAFKHLPQNYLIAKAI